MPDIPKNFELNRLQGDFESIRQTLEFIRHHVVKTPVRRLDWMKRLGNFDVVAKLENHQLGASFKIRGALNRIRVQPKNRPIFLASAGNHALGMAEAANILGHAINICIPTNASPIKKERLTAYSQHRLFQYGSSLDETTEYVRELAEKQKGDFISPFNDIDIIHGQGTVALEFLEQVKEIDTIVVPTGGGGLLAGIAIVAKSISPSIKIVAVQPEMYASYIRSVEAGNAQRVMNFHTLADGLAVNLDRKSMTLDFADLIDEFITVDEEEIAAATYAIYHHESLIVEPSGAIGLAALMSNKLKTKPSEKVGTIFTGGNVPIGTLSEILTYYYKNPDLIPYLNVVADTVHTKPIVRGADFSRQTVINNLQEAAIDQETDVQWDSLFLENRFSHIEDVIKNIRQKIDDYLKFSGVQDLVPNVSATSLASRITDDVQTTMNTLQIDLSSNESVEEYSKKYRRLWEEYRSLLYQILSVDAFNFRSASYDQSVFPEFGQMESQNNPNCNYNRYESSEVKEVEAMLAEILQLNQADYSPILTSSGMAAYKLIEDYLMSYERLKPGEKIMIANYIYFETDENISKFKSIFPILRPHCHNPEKLLKEVIKEEPKLLFVDPLTNTEDLRLFPIEKFITELAKTELKDQLYIVIDGTMLPAEVSGKLSTLAGKNKRMTILYYESASKYLQLGLDIAMGGVAVVPTNDLNEFDRLRRNTGNIMYEPIVSIFPRYTRDEHVKRMRRFQRNAILLGTEVNTDKRINTEIKANYPTLPDHPDNHWAEEYDNLGGVITFTLTNRRFQHREELNNLIHYVIEHCKDVSSPIVKGVSFGFSQPRISAAASIAETAPPFLRLSVGDRTFQEVQVLSKAIRDGIAAYVQKIS